MQPRLALDPLADGRRAPRHLRRAVRKVHRPRDAGVHRPRAGARHGARPAARPRLLELPGLDRRPRKGQRRRLRRVAVAKGAGRAGDTCPPLPSSTASPKTELAVGDKIILYIHGGAFVLCNHSTHRLITYELVRRTGAVVLAPEYTRPPAAAYPVALDEMVSVYRKVVGFYDPANVIVAGDSAGGNLALTVDEGDRLGLAPAPRALLLISAGCDLSAAALDAPSMAANAPTEAAAAHRGDRPLRRRLRRRRRRVRPAHRRPASASSTRCRPPSSRRHRREPMDQVEALVAALQRAGPPRRRTPPTRCEPRRRSIARLRLARGAGGRAARRRRGRRPLLPPPHGGGARRNRGVRQVALGAAECCRSSTSDAELRPQRVKSRG